MRTKIGILLVTVCLIATLGMISCAKKKKVKIKDFEQIAEEAFIYAYPINMAYATIYNYSIDKNSGQYKGPFNEIINEARLFTPNDTAVVTPNSDTPYSFVLMDLRREPLVLTMPKVEQERYYSVQLTSLYTFNFGYIGSRTTGNSAGSYAVVGPNWNGDIPQGISKVFRSETELAIAIYRTQLFNPADMDSVKKIQSGYKVESLSKFMNVSAPADVPEINWFEIKKKMVVLDPFNYLDFLLQFCPPIGSAAVEKPLRDKFATIGIEVGKPFFGDKLRRKQKIKLEKAIQNGKGRIKRRISQLGKNINGWRVATSGFGDRADCNGDWTLRAAAAMAGIFGNDAVEALYPMTRIDRDGNRLDGSRNNYTLTFAKDELPPVNAFWSVTMYDSKTQLLIENPINRYLINSSMLADLKKNDDGSLTIYIQKDTPGKDKESNWLPAPNGPIFLVMRLYWPKESALKSVWKPPAINKV